MSAVAPTAAEPIAEIVRRCRAEQTRWAREPVRRRLRLVRAFRHLLADEADALGRAVERDLGRPPAEVIATLVVPLADACRFLEVEAPRLLRPRSVSIWRRPLWLWGNSDTVYRRTHGVVGIIGTWNYPLYLYGVQMAQGLAAGNGVVWKPSEVAPASAEALHGLFLRAGFPPELVARLPATREAGPVLAEADIDHVVFTGSANVGRNLAARLGERLVSSTLELSGCDPMFVLADADVAMAARAAWIGATLNRGQTCLAVRRAFVHHSVYRAFVEALRPLAAGAAPVTLALESQARQAERMVAEAVEGGAERLGGPTDG